MIVMRIKGVITPTLIIEHDSVVIPRIAKLTKGPSTPKFHTYRVPKGFLLMLHKKEGLTYLVDVWDELVELVNTDQGHCRYWDYFLPKLKDISQTLVKGGCRVTK